ncbi:MAG TPA: filamentous hemagglutinin N-terminal domain-containing protein, partial [Noviherbaspirillum sp.]
MKTRLVMHDPHATRSVLMLRRRVLPVLIAGCFGSVAVLANPVGPQVMNGQVGFISQGNVLSIVNTPGAIINWQNFSIDAGETTRFIQQNASSAVLNRILGQDPSRILGALQSNGKVFLINPNGVLFGQGARVDVNGLVASTLNISNEDFIAGRLNFKAGDKAAAISNQGAIKTPAGGQVFLIAPHIENSGIITSPKGDVVLAAGHTVNLADSSNPDIQVVVSAPEHEALNLGRVIAEGGRIGIYGALVNQRGTVSANSAVVGENGKIVFKASKDTVLDTASVTTATGEGKGGEIQVLGERIGLFGNAKVDASGKTGGGTVLVGGDYQGKNHDVPNAATTYFGRNAEIKADAIDNGDGGKVIVWADDTTKAYGRISARGGDQSGNGGLVETSGKRSLVFRSRVDTGARNGKAGRLLLDPLDITVADGAGGADDALLSDNLIGAGEPNTTTNVTISEQALEALSGTVTLQASGNVIFNNLTDDLISLSNVTNFTVSAGGGVTAADVNDRIVTSGGSVSIIAGGGNVDIGGVKSGGGAVSISATGNAIVREIVTMPGGGNAGNISISSGGLMTLGGGHIDARGAGGSAGNVTLTSGGAIGMQTGKTIYGNQLKMTAAGGIYGTTAADPMSTQVSTLNARNTGSSDIKISNSGGNLSIADIGTVGYGVKQDAVGGVVELATDATRTLDINAPIRSQGGAISLAGPGGINLHASSQPEISSNGGMISLAASDAGAKISTDAGTQINSNGGSIALQADKMQLLGSMNATSSGIVKLAPQAGTAIHLGTVNTDLTNATLELSNTELGGIAAGTVLVGDANSGAIDVKSTLSTGFAAMGLTSAGAITQQPGALL